MSDIAWNPGPTLLLVAQRMARALGRIGARMETSAKELVSRPNTPVRGPRGGKARGRNPSLPGEPPKRVFGQLRSGIAFEVIVGPLLIILRFGIFKGSPAEPYAAALEFGFAGYRHVATHSRLTGPGFKVTGKKTRRFTAKLGPARLSQVGAFDRSYTLAARPFIRPTYNLMLPQIPGLLSKAAQ